MPYEFQYDRGITGETLYAFIRPLGHDTIWNTVDEAFVTYAVGDWTEYDIPMTEQASSGSYFGTWPDLPAEGWYQFTVYPRDGVTPVSSDAPPVGSGPLYYEPSSTPPVPTVPNFSGVWYAHAAVEDVLTSETLYKRDGDTVTLAMCCCNLPEIQAAETITAASVPVVAGLTISGVGFNDENAWAVFAGGTAGTTYTVAFLITLSGGDIYERSGYLEVETV